MTVTHLCLPGVSGQALAEKAHSLAVAAENRPHGRVGLATQRGTIWDYAPSPDPTSRCLSLRPDPGKSLGSGPPQAARYGPSHRHGSRGGKKPYLSRAVDSPGDRGRGAPLAAAQRYCCG